MMSNETTTTCMENILNFQLGSIHVAMAWYYKKQTFENLMDLKATSYIYILYPNNNRYRLIAIIMRYRKYI